MHFARDWGERPQPKSKWRGWRAERTGFVQTNLRRKKKLTAEKIWIIFFGSQFRLLLAANTIQISTNKKKCWLKHQLCNTVTVKICGSLPLDGLLVVTLESVNTDTIIFVVHGPLNFANAEDSRLLGGPEAIAPWEMFQF